MVCSGCFGVLWLGLQTLIVMIASSALSLSVSLCRFRSWALCRVVILLKGEQCANSNTLQQSGCRGQMMMLMITSCTISCQTGKSLSRKVLTSVLCCPAVITADIFRAAAAAVPGGQKWRGVQSGQWPVVTAAEDLMMHTPKWSHTHTLGEHQWCEQCSARGDNNKDRRERRGERCGRLLLLFGCNHCCCCQLLLNGS